MNHLDESVMNALLEKMSPDDINILGEENFKKRFNAADNMSLLDIEVALKRVKKDSDQLTELLALLELQKSFNERELRQPVEELNASLPANYKNELNTNPEALLQNAKIKMGKEEATNALVIQKCWETILSYVKEIKYGGTEMTEIEKIIDKLEVDRITITEGKSTNKTTMSNRDAMIREIDDTIERLKNLNAEFLLGSIPTDGRLVASAKRCIKDTDLVDKIFGPEMNEKFCQVFGAFIQTAIHDINEHAAKNLAGLLIWSIAKKAKSNLKSKDYRSLVFRAYIITLMIDLEPGSKKSVLYMNNVLYPIIPQFLGNPAIVRLIGDKDVVLYKSSKVKNEK